MIFTKLYAANSWDSVAKTQEKGFFDFEFITWMAWTWQTAAFFVFIACCVFLLLVDCFYCLRKVSIACAMCRLWNVSTAFGMCLLLVECV